MAASKNSSGEGDVDAYMKRVYYDPQSGGSFQRFGKVWGQVEKDGNPHDLSRGQVRGWLEGQETYRLYSQPEKNFDTQRIVPTYMDELWDSDVMSMIGYKKYNGNFAYVLVCVDAFSKYVWARPLKQKSAAEMTRAFKEIFGEGRKPSTLRSDQGKKKSCLTFLYLCCLT